MSQRRAILVFLTSPRLRMLKRHRLDGRLFGGVLKSTRARIEIGKVILLYVRTSVEFRLFQRELGLKLVLATLDRSGTQILARVFYGGPQRTFTVAELPSIYPRAG